MWDSWEQRNWGTIPKRLQYLYYWVQIRQFRFPTIIVQQYSAKLSHLWVHENCFVFNGSSVDINMRQKSLANWISLPKLFEQIISTMVDQVNKNTNTVDISWYNTQNNEKRITLDCVFFINNNNYIRTAVPSQFKLIYPF